MAGRTPTARQLPGPRLGAAGRASGALLITAALLYLLVSWLEGFGLSFETDPSRWLCEGFKV